MHSSLGHINIILAFLKCLGNTFSALFVFNPEKYWYGLIGYVFDSWDAAGEINL